MIRVSCTTIKLIHTNLPHLHCRWCHFFTACNLFDQMPIRDAAVSNSPSDVSLKVKLDRFSYAGALNTCVGAGGLRKGQMIHGRAVTTGMFRHSFVTNSLIDMYSMCEHIDEARFVFDRTEELDDASWNSLFSAYVRIGWPEVAVDILVWMHWYGATLNCFALCSVLEACSHAGESESMSNDTQRMLYGCVMKIGLDLDLFMDSAVADMYAENGGLDEVIKIFEQMHDRDSVVFRAMVAGLSWLGAGTCAEVRVEALRLYSEMLRRCIRASKFTYKSVLRVCELTRDFECAKQIHAHVITDNLEDDELVASSLIEMYSASGLIENASKCFRVANKNGIDVWSSLISGFVFNEHFENALCLFVELLSRGSKPDELTISILLMACANLGVLRSGEQIQSHATKTGFHLFAICGNSQINMYAKLGDLEGAVRTFEEIQTPDVGSWSAMILSHAINGCEKIALKLFEEMQYCSVVPNLITFLHVLVACDRGGLAGEGFRYFESMQIDYDMTPTAKHIACIVGLLGQLGRLAEAEDLVRSSCFAREPLVWKVLLQSCQFHGDNERGIRVGKMILELDPSKATSYMLLYNMYLSIGRISMAMRTRGLMRERGVNRETDTCWIEIGGLVHSFTSGDCSHPRSDAIYLKLDDMLFKIKDVGQADVKILQLEYGSDKWNGSLMTSHGEMLALAIGVLSLPKQLSIRLMKNLRVCTDCHTTLKLLSESERREIVIRDPTRIHHFRLGVCSCRDYW